MSKVYLVGFLRRRAFRRMLDRLGLSYIEDAGWLDSQFVIGNIPIGTPADCIQAFFKPKPEPKPEWDYVRTAWNGEKFYYTEAERAHFAPVELEMLGPISMRALLDRRMAK